MTKRFILFAFCALSLLFNGVVAEAQQRSPIRTNIKGVVRDSLTREGLPFVAIFLKGSDKGALTDENGNFAISTTANFISLNLSTIGYNEKVVFVNKGKDNNVVIDMVPTGVALKELVVKPKKEKYSKKNNPAVDFVQKLMDRKRMYDPKNHEYYNFDKYEKMNFALNDFSEEQKKKWLFKKFKFIFEYMDTSEVSGKPILNVSFKEKISKFHYRKSPASEKEYVKGITSAGIDEIFDEESVQRFVEEVFREIDIFGNDITLLLNRFVSPLSNIGTNYYKYYLTDTINVEGVKCIELSFSPHTPESFGFLGRIYVPLGDTTMFIKRVKLNVPKSINLNYVQNIFIVQDFEKAPDGSRLKTKDDMTVEFQILPSTQGLYARRVTLYKNHDFLQPQDEEIFNKEGKEIVAEDASIQPDEFWKENRQTPIKKSENAMGKLLTRLREVPVFYWSEKVILALVTGYIPTNGDDSKFDFGPMNTTLNGNSLEGFRVRVGGITTANLNNRLFARGYVAYGFEDKKLKYQGELEYSFNDKKYHSREFPIHSIKLSHKYDVDKLGQQYLFTNMDNLFLVLKRKIDNKMTYQRLTRLEYKMERKGGFSLTAGFSHDIQEATSIIPFEDGYGNVYKDFTEASFDLTLRYAPGEKFYQSKTNRYPINFDAPVFTLKHTFAPKGFLGTKYTINKTEISVQKRFWLSAFGYTDIRVSAAKLWSEVSYPNLLLPNANLSYTIQPQSYSLMNAMEFANDQYLSWDLTYWANGALFNRIPLIKYLKLREVVSFRGLYGSLKESNNPEFNNDLFRFPTGVRCKPMDKIPYMEFGIGIDNIFTFLRVDYVWRLTYREAPGVDLSGFRIQMHFSF
ncbi:MAG: DUF5686 family protein [Muribaculaceae bacterium]|nr:DUF5686 family protein [Muribaculaceae bacterium]